MSAAPSDRLEAALPAGASVLIDSSVVLAYLVGGEAASQDAEQLFDRFVASGRNPALISSITVEEILVRPFRQGSTAVAMAEGFLRHFADMRIVPVDYEVAREGARIRAATNLRTPDALIVASALVAGVDVLVTSDISWRPRLKGLGPDPSIIELPFSARTTKRGRRPARA